MAMSPMPPAVDLDKLLALDEHAARAATRVEHAALVRGEHFDQHADDAAGRVELAALLAFGAGELGEEVFVDAAQDVFGAVLGIAQPDGADEVDQFAQAMLVERRPGVVLGQDAFQPGIITLDGDHRLIDELADCRLLGLALEMRPPGLLRHPEDVLGPVFVGIFGVGPLVLGRQKPLVHLLERVGDVLEEDQAQDDVLVLRRIHVVAELVGGEPQLGLEPEVGSVAVTLAAGCDPLLAHFAVFHFQCSCPYSPFLPSFLDEKLLSGADWSGRPYFIASGGTHKQPMPAASPGQTIRAGAGLVAVRTQSVAMEKKKRATALFDNAAARTCAKALGIEIVGTLEDGAPGKAKGRNPIGSRRAQGAARGGPSAG